MTSTTEMTREELGKALCAKFLEDMVEGGVLRRSRIGAKGLVTYAPAGDVIYEDLVEAGDDWLAWVREGVGHLDDLAEEQLDDLRIWVRMVISLIARRWDALTCEKILEELAALKTKMCQMALDRLVEDGIFRVSHIDEKGRKVYVGTDAVNRGNLHVNGPATKQ